MTEASGPRRRLVCAENALPDGQGRGFELGRWSLVIVRRGNRLFGYDNRCPHRGTSLDWTPDKFISADGAHLQCATHGALFRFEDGLCVAGPCSGQALRPRALVVADGQVWLSADER